MRSDDHTCVGSVQRFESAELEIIRGRAASLRPAVVAIDGPAASGKSTVGYRLAEILDFLFFDTGVMYRAATWAALRRGIELSNIVAVGDLAHEIKIDLAPASPLLRERGRLSSVLVDGIDITEEIQTPAIDQHVSAVSAIADVRKALSQQQRRIGLRYGNGYGDKAGVVMVGRDIGTVVMRDASLKIYLDASLEVRAKRRYRELATRGKHMAFTQVREDIIRRDRLDSERALSPLRVAEDAVVIDTSNLSVDQVLLHIVAALEKMPGATNNALTNHRDD